MAEICNGGIIMKYGKIRIEDGNLVFARQRHINDIGVSLVHFRLTLMGMENIP